MSGATFPFQARFAVHVHPGQPLPSALCHGGFDGLDNRVVGWIPYLLYASRSLSLPSAWLFQAGTRHRRLNLTQDAFDIVEVVEGGHDDQADVLFPAETRLDCVTLPGVLNLLLPEEADDVIVLGALVFEGDAHGFIVAVKF